jgi:uncharacterized phage-like protein YoqJ
LFSINLSEPFSVANETDIVNLARYLIEETSEEFVLYDSSKKNSVDIIASILKKVLQHYKIPTEKERQLIQ